MALVSLLLGSPQKGTRVDRRVGNTRASIILDATIKEDFSAPVEITTHPVERRSDISDHVIKRPQKLRIEGIISETPFDVNAQIAGVTTTVASTIGQNLGGALGSVAANIGANQARTLAGVLGSKSAVSVQSLNGQGEPIGPATQREIPGNSSRLRDAITEFKNIRDACQPVTIITGLQQYENYLLAGFDVTRGSDSGGSISVTLEFQEMQIATSTTVKIEIPKKKSAIPTADQGKKNATPVKDQETSSFLLKGFKGAGGLFK